MLYLFGRCCSLVSESAVRALGKCPEVPQTMQAVAQRCSARDLLCHYFTNNAWGLSKFRVFVVLFFPNQDWIRRLERVNLQISVFSPNTGKYWSEKLRIWTLYTLKILKKVFLTDLFSRAFFWGVRQSFREQLLFWHHLNMCFLNRRNVFSFKIFGKAKDERVTAQKMKFSIKDFFSTCDQVRSFLWM